MSNQTFPAAGVQRLVSRAPFFETTVQAGDSGAEYRIRRRAVGYRYSLSISLRVHLGEHTDLFGFFTEHGGMADSFLFTDPMDGIVRRVRFDQDDITGSFEPGLFTADVDLVTVVVP